MQNKVNTVVIPGDVIGYIADSKLHLGPGIIQNRDTLIATKAGILRYKPPDRYWIENNQKRVLTLLILRFTSSNDCFLIIVNEERVYHLFSI
jgi:hypothetical protein